MTALNTRAPASTLPNGIEVRPATQANIPAISHLGTTVFASTFGHSMPKKDLDQYLVDAYSLESIMKDFENPNDDIIVATNGVNDIVGFAQLTKGTSEPCLEGRRASCELQRLYVRSDQHGKGIGSSLMRRVDEMAREQGFEGLWIGVWEEHVNAHRLYQSQGFKKIGGKTFTCGSVVQKDWIMWKVL